MEARRRIQSNRQLDLFAPSPPALSNGMPGWDSFPDQTRRKVTSLVARLLIAHARGEMPEPGSDADEL